MIQNGLKMHPHGRLAMVTNVDFGRTLGWRNNLYNKNSLDYSRSRYKKIVLFVRCGLRLEILGVGTSHESHNSLSGREYY